MEDSPKKIRIFYDGYCGFCHRFVRFLLPRIGENSIFVFSPQQGTSFEQFKTICTEKLPDSIVVYNPNTQEYYTRGEAIIFILSFLGKGWRVLARVLQLLPLPLVNMGYRIIAKIRYWLFKKPKGTCPVIPPTFRKYFEE